MTEKKVIIVFGLPGAGKTTLIQKAVKQKEEFIRLSGGSLIGAALPEKERDLLRKKASNEILLNQEKLVHNFQKGRSATPEKHVIFDGHCVVKNGEQVTEIPVGVISRLTPDYIVFIDEKSETIIERRKNDASRPDREEESVAALDKNREMQIKICDNYAKILKIPFKVFSSAKSGDFIEFLESIK